MPSKLAATWFGENEVSTACAIGVFGNQVIYFCFFFVLKPKDMVGFFNKKLNLVQLLSLNFT